MSYYAPEAHKYLTFWPRFWAPVVDELILWLPTVLIGIPVALSGGDLSLFASLSLTALYFIYSIHMHGTYGATVGKITTRIRVVDAETEQPITYRQAFLRDSVPLGFTVVLVLVGFGGGRSTKELQAEIGLIFLGWFLAEIVTMFANDKRRAIEPRRAGWCVDGLAVWEIRMTKRRLASSLNPCT
ncbi:MAG: hypothetical protein CMO80_18800 [Verrucomicrobiales bacterium]|nr:hypothetical protein [Verrucomicrobiales bacterium]|tara:strand:+ start:353 stop:907 length:555 start_codon:yes stop_codon:yes gene_type:complete